jgi:hypothetical protein
VAETAEQRSPGPVRRPGRLHGLAIGGMALSALLGITTMIAFVTIGWPGDSGRVLIGVFIGAVVGFMSCASIAVFSAARDTYPRHTPEA